MLKLMRKNFSKIIHPNSMIFQHKKQLDKTHKYITRMSRPAWIEKIDAINEPNFFSLFSNFYNFNSFKIYTTRESPNNEPKVCPSRCFTELIVPFSSDSDLREKFCLLSTESLRSGLLMELLDYFSGMIAYKYVGGLRKDYALVTASVDKFEISKQITVKKDLIITGYPTWTSQSTIEIRLDIYQPDSSEIDSSKYSDNSFLGSSYFIYASRDASDYSKKKEIPSLDYENEKLPNDELEKVKLRIELGQESNLRRKLENKESLENKSPTQEESDFIHQIFKDFKNNPSKYKSINETQMDKSILFHSQNMNIHAKVFGGFIMRMALELAFVTAFKHTGSHPKLLCIDSVNFYKSANIGSIGYFKANICFVYEELINLSVYCFNIENDQEILTTIIDVTFLSKNRSKNVVPVLYEDSSKLIHGKRKLEKLFNY